MNPKLLYTTIALIIFLQFLQFFLFGLMQREIELQGKVIDAMVNIIIPPKVSKTLIN